MGPNTTNLRCREDTAGALCTLRAGDNNSIFCRLLLGTSLTPSGEKSICLSLMLARHECSCVVLAFQLARTSYVDLVRGPTCVPPVPVEHASKFLVLANGGPRRRSMREECASFGLGGFHNLACLGSSLSTQHFKGLHSWLCAFQYGVLCVHACGAFDLCCVVCCALCALCHVWCVVWWCCGVVMLWCCDVWGMVCGMRCVVCRMW